MNSKIGHFGGEELTECQRLDGIHTDKIYTAATTELDRITNNPKYR
jgi:hypothetical protein